MDVFLARQPIFDQNKRLFAYELLFRESMDNVFPGGDSNKATTSLLSSTFLTEGIEKITGSKPGFINFTGELLQKNIPNLFPKTKLVVEVLEDVEPTPEVISACKKISKSGYTLALDDFVYERKLEPLIELADIIKIDFRLTSIDEIERMLYRLSRYNIKYLAEKIETYDEFDKAVKMGFRYYQGYFFSRPEMVRIKEIASSKINLLQLLVEVNKKEITPEEIEKIVSSDVAISYKLLRYINSAYYYLLMEVKSVKQALVYLGERGTRQFVSLVVISELAADKPGELIRTSILRARFCELLGEKSKFQPNSSQLFLLGLFSLLDAILDTSMKEVMTRLPLTSEHKKALLEQAGPLWPYLSAVVAYERRHKDVCLRALNEIGVDPRGIYATYLEAVKLADTLATV